MSNEQNLLFLKAAVKKGYLNSEQASFVLSKCKDVHASLRTQLHDNQLLSQQQILEIEQFLQQYHQNSTSTNITDSRNKPVVLQQKSIDRYQILQMLGKGGMGTVYKCWDSKLQRTVALKTLIRQGDDSYVERFLVEIRATIKLHHPNIIRIYDVGEENGIHFFTMDYLCGMTFREVIHDRKISQRKAIQMLIKIVQALDYAHNQKIIHRDLKPSNIMVDDDMEPFIVDFGLAKMVDQNNQITESGTILGTPHYMAPEQASGNLRRIDNRTDIYALGVILYEAITGKLPFYGVGRVELFVKIIEKTAQRPSTINKRIPKELDAICMKALSKKKEQRYHSATLFAEDLQKYLDGKTTLASHEKRKKQIRAGLPIVCIFLLLTIILFIIVSSTSSEKQQQTSPQTASTKNKIAKLITIENEKPLISLIRHCYDGSELDLGKQKITDDDLTYILQSIPRLTTIDLSKVKTISGSSLAHLERFSNTLTRVDLKACSVKNSYIKHLQKLRVLDRLDLEETNLNNMGLASLKSIKTLVSLDVSESKIDSLVYVKDMTSLERLVLEKTNIDDDDLRYIKNLTKLRRLYLNRTNITSLGLRYLKKMRYLEKLGLKSTNVDNNVVEHLEKLANLKELELQGTKVTLETMRKIQEFLPYCKIKYSKN
ncbi:protein kinase [Candidatus Uabimicrobium sp. HlEnr_7]|uniref:protein kinase domain-containing protein n=1 Tax=Candidatus Uabimicrobium helgolandensis TaxID=3095367 RepID=UPI003556F22A